MADAQRGWVLLKCPDEDEQREYALSHIEEGKHMAGMRERFEQLGEQRGIQKGLLKGLEEGRREGREEGIQLGEERRLRKVLARLLTARFGPMDASVERHMQQAGMEQLEHWTELAMTAQGVDEVYRVQ